MCTILKLCTILAGPGGGAGGLSAGHDPEAVEGAGAAGGAEHG